MTVDLDKTTLAHLCQMAMQLEAERTDGSAPALYLLVERMRPVLTALVLRIQGFQKDLAEVSANQDRIEATFSELRAENETLVAENARLEDLLGQWGTRG